MPRTRWLFRLVALACVWRSQAASADESTVAQGHDCKRRIVVGVEADVLPYVLGGAHGDVWAGLDGWRARAIAATTPAPSFFTPAGFDDLRTTIVEMELDRFFGPNAAEFRGPWIAAGGGFSYLTIAANDHAGAGSISAFEVSGGVGWTIPVLAGFYVDPWVGFTYEFTPEVVAVGTQEWRPTRLNPLLGIKIGWSVTL